MSKLQRTAFGTKRTIIIVVAAVGCAVILVGATYCIIQRWKKKPLPARKKAASILAPWLFSSSPVYISRPIQAQYDEKPCRDQSLYEEICAEPVMYGGQGLTATYRPQGRCLATELKQVQTEIAPPAPNNIWDRQAAVASPASNLEPHHALLDRPLPAHGRNASIPHTISISTTSRRFRLDKRTTTQSLAPKPLIRGKTIVIHNDTQMRPSSVYSNDDYRVSVYPSTPSDPGSSFSRHITPVASRHASFMMPRWQNERVPEIPEGY